MASSEFNTGFGATSTLTQVIKERKLNPLQIFKFRKECCTVLVTIGSKIQKRDPLKYNFARKLATLDPRTMVTQPEIAVKMFQQLHAKLVQKKWKTSEEVYII